MKIKIQRVLLAAALPSAAFMLGGSIIYRVFTVESSTRLVGASSALGFSRPVLAAGPAGVLGCSSNSQASSQKKTEERWKLYDPQFLKKDHRVWLNAEALFMQPHVGSLSYGVTSSSSSSIQDGDVKSPHFNWNVGYRAGIGYKIPHDQWDLFANYTYLYGSAQGSAGGNANSVIFPTWATNFSGESSFYANAATAHWNMHLNMGDLELGRNCFAGKWVSIRPFVGIRGMTINQNYRVKYEGGTVAPGAEKDKVNLNTDFWGVGLRMGFNSLWGIGKGLSLYGNGSASLLSGHFDVHEKEKLIKAHMQKMNISSIVNNVVVDADISLGLQWDYLFSKDRYHFGVKMGWEFDMFFNQNQLFNFVGTNPGAISFKNDDLSFQGITLGFRFDF